MQAESHTPEIWAATEDDVQISTTVRAAGAESRSEGILLALESTSSRKMAGDDRIFADVFLTPADADRLAQRLQLFAMQNRQAAR